MVDLKCLMNLLRLKTAIDDNCRLMEGMHTSLSEQYSTGVVSGYSKTCRSYQLPLLKHAWLTACR